MLFILEESHRSTNSVVYQLCTACHVQLYISSAFETKLLESFVKKTGVTLLSVSYVSIDVHVLFRSRRQETILLFSNASSMVVRAKRELAQPYWIVKLVYQGK